MSDDWRNDPATDKQKAKLHFFGCTWDDGITKGQASDAIDECVKQFPEKETAYQNRPATEQQKSTLRGFGKRPRVTLTYEKAKELIKECETADWQKEIEEIEKEYIIDVEDWAELYPGITWKRVQTAAQTLDKARPGWREDKNHIDIMLEKAAELNPQLLERWKKKAEKTATKHGAGRRSKKGDASWILIVLAILFWIIYKMFSK